MAINSIIGQHRVQDALRRMLSSGRVAHALLFHGPEGTGKLAGALAMARALQCSDPVEGDACGGCPACLKSAKGLHPDIHVLMPITKDTDDNERSQRIQKVWEDPYQPADMQSLPSLSGKGGSSNLQIWYRIEHIQEWLRRPMSYHRVEGRYRVAILIGAERIREDAANAFLKLLEEPGKQSVFILITDRVDHLLPTILSRCQQIRFDPLETSDIAHAMEVRGAPPPLAAMLARMSGGSLRRAIALSGNEDLLSAREDVITFLRKSFQGRGDTVVSMVDYMSRSGRESVKFQLSVLLGILRDLLLLQYTGQSGLLVNLDQLDTLQRFAANLPDARIEDMIEAVEQTLFLVERNVNVRLALVALSRSLQAAMRGDGSSAIQLDLAVH
jgi:DNA polymerase-3 subunit delta'